MLAIGGVNKERKGSVEVWSTQTKCRSNPPAAAAEPENKAGDPRNHKFKTGVGVKMIACSEDGKLVAFANGGPTFVGMRSKSNIVDNWKPSAKVVDAKTGEVVAALQAHHG